MISSLLKLYARQVLHDIAPRENVLLFANIHNTGIGNLVWLYQTMKALEPIGLTVVCEHEEMSKILQYNLPTARVVRFKNIPNIKYGTSVNNFLTQTTQNIRQIISLRINCRIGHSYINRLKYASFFTYRLPMNNYFREGSANVMLLQPFIDKRLIPDIIPELKLELPPERYKHNKFDVLIQPCTSNETKRNFLHYFEVIKKLKCKVGLIGSAKELDYCESLAFKTKATNLCGMSLIDTAHLMKKAVVVGNDGGLVKLAYAIGAPVLQIDLPGSEYVNRSWIPGSTIMNPEPETVVYIINKLLEGK